MLLAGKLVRWGVIGAIHPGNLVHVKDDISGASFLVDTGSSYSILPFSSPLPPTGPLLKSAGGQKIPCWGRRRLTISLGGRRYTWCFLLAAVTFRILGVDFLQKFQLLVDSAAHRLCSSPPSSSSPTSSPPSSSSPSPATTAAVAASDTAKLSSGETSLLAEFSSVLNEEGRLPPATHGVEHHIITSGRPVTAKFR